ncbi:unnamed protein product [Durusdinium trenchii]|uniref:Uncharacterized protein n=2 Tax=Durusdinium trenchii TaxID=1381693 RepID=A0ABP0NVI2_9DINO
MRLLCVLLVVRSAVADLTFVVPKPSFSLVPRTLVVPDQSSGAQGALREASGSTAAVLLGASAVLLALGRRARPSGASGTARNVWSFFDMEKKEDGYGKDAATVGWRSYQMLRKQSKLTMGRKIRYMRQQKILRDNNVNWGRYGSWTEEVKNKRFRNMYQGPESHPDNPDFPRPFSGLPALGGGAPSVGLACSAPRRAGTTLAGSFGSLKRAVFTPPRARSALVLHAHKKAAASTKNQGSARNPHFWGVKALNGKSVKCRQLLVKQKGMNWYPGENVMRCKNDSLIALKDGIVQWKGDYKHREISVVPWEYVNEKCQWLNSGTLGPKEYEPWMGSRLEVTLKMKRRWLDTPEGAEWNAKKQEKAALQKEIQKKIRAKKALRWKKDLTPKREKVVAGDSDSEK